VLLHRRKLWGSLLSLDEAGAEAVGWARGHCEHVEVIGRRDGWASREWRIMLLRVGEKWRALKQGEYDS
jgi:hypothetical protein